MNRDQFKKCIGQTLRLQPHAIGAQGESRDDDWTVELNADEDEVVLKHMGSGEGVVVGFDHVHSYMSDQARGKTHGFLQTLSQIRIAPDGTISAVPLPPRQTGIVRPTFNPLVVNDGTADRYLTWSARDPEHLIAHEGQPRQLYGTYTEICDALRTATGREPQFDRPNDIRHEIVWELTADHESKHKLLGELDERCDAAFGDIDAILAERHALIPNLVEAVKAFAGQEHKVLKDVIDARARATSTTGGTRLDAEAKVGQSLVNLWSIAETYPELASSQHFRELRSEMSRVEERITASRRFYNLAVEEKNGVARAFPGSLIARFARLEAHEKFSLGEQRAALSEPLRVSF